MIKKNIFIVTETQTDETIYDYKVLIFIPTLLPKHTICKCFKYVINSQKNAIQSENRS